MADQKKMTDEPVEENKVTIFHEVVQPNQVANMQMPLETPEVGSYEPRPNPDIDHQISDSW
jgi:hypothetical protein